MSETIPAPRRPSSPPPPGRPAWRNAVAILVVILIALALAVFLTFCARHGAAPGSGGGRGGRAGRAGAASGGPGARPPITVGVAKAVLGDIPITVSALGTVTPLATVSLQARVSGMLDKVAFKEGQLVRKGQLLVQIDPRPFQVALDQAQATLLHDEALLADAKLDLQRYATLRATDSIAGQTYDTQAALVKQDEATVANDKAGVGNARLNLSFTRITSPVSGRIGLRQIDAGNQITANQTTPFTVVTQVDPIAIVFSAPEEAIASIVKHGAKGLPTTAYDRDGGAVIATGTLSTLDNLIDPTTGTVKAKAQFANPGAGLFPNQFVNVVLLVDTLRNQVVVPTTATRHGPQGDFVWVLQPNKTVKSRLVKAGPGTPETVSIVSGLNVGESVITDGGDRLRDGATVILPGQTPGGSRGGHGHHRSAAANEAAPADAAPSPPAVPPAPGAGGKPPAGGWQGRVGGHRHGTPGSAAPAVGGSPAGA